MTQDTELTLFQTALGFHQMGQLDQAKLLYHKLIANNPKHANAYHLLGVIGLQTGDYDRAIELINQAIEHNPKSAAFYSNLANAHKRKGDLVQAVTYFEKALSIDDYFLDALNNLGNTLRQLGQTKDSLKYYEKVIQADPDFFEAYTNLGNAYTELGQLDDAVDAFKQSLNKSPNTAIANNNLGHALWLKGELIEAKACFEASIQQNDTLPDPYHNMANLYAYEANYAKAIELYRQALERFPNYAEAKRGLAKVLITEKKLGYSDWLVDYLVDVFKHNQVSHQSLAKVTADLLESKYTTGLKANDATSANRLMDDELLHQLLTKTINVSPWLELLLTGLRKSLLNQYPFEAKPNVKSFLSGLAQQCALNEFVFSTGQDEQKTLDALKNDLPSPERDETLWLLLCCYQPLQQLVNALPEPKPNNWPKSLVQLAKYNAYTKDEAELKKDLNHLPGATSIDTDVKAHYETNPYPRWIQLPDYRSVNIIPFFKKKFTDVQLPFKEDHRPKLLVAGCGAGQHPIQLAKRHPDCDITAIDISENSLAYATRMAKHHNIDNVNFYCGDLSTTKTLGIDFDVIESVGVLHHLSSPQQGWQALIESLKPNGLMRVGLYSQLGRQAIEAAKKDIKKNQLSATDEGVKAFRQRLLQTNAHPSIFEIRDFYSLSECRDCFFHTQETMYNLGQIKKMLKTLGLAFLSFELPMAAEQAFVETYGKKALTDLSKWQNFETTHPETFANMYQFWCQKS